MSDDVKEVRAASINNPSALLEQLDFHIKSLRAIALWAKMTEEGMLKVKAGCQESEEHLRFACSISNTASVHLNPIKMLAAQYTSVAKATIDAELLRWDVPEGSVQ